MVAPCACAMLVALSTMTSAVSSADHVEMALHLPKLTLQVPATVPAAASPRLQQDRSADPEADVDITGPTH
jgi:hypothetical protein